MAVKHVRIRSRSHRGAVGAREAGSCVKRCRIDGAAAGAPAGPRDLWGPSGESGGRLGWRGARQTASSARQSLVGEFVYELDRDVAAPTVRPAESQGRCEPKCTPGRSPGARARPIGRLRACGAVAFGPIAEERPCGMDARGPIAKERPCSRWGLAGRSPRSGHVTGRVSRLVAVPSAPPRRSGGEGGAPARPSRRGRRQAGAVEVTFTLRPSHI